MSTTPINDAKRSKPPKTPAHLRKPQILALQALGWTQERIAAHFGVHRRTIVQDLEDLRPAQTQIRNIVDDISDELAKLQTPGQVASNLVELATSAKNEAVRQGSQAYVIELRGGITDRERLRTKTQEDSGSQPIFQRSPGMNINFTFQQFNANQQSISHHDTPTCSEVESLHNTSTATLNNTTTTDRHDTTIDTASVDDTSPHE